MRLSAGAVSVLLLALLPLSCATPLALPDAETNPPATASFTRNLAKPAALPPSADVEASPVTARPVRLRIPAIGVNSSLETLRVAPTGELEPPVNPQLAGWFPGSAVPGDLGPAIIAGHRDSVHGPAVFWRLTDLRPGNRVSVTRSDGVVAVFKVAQVRRVSRKTFPTEQVYGPTPEGTLRLITCGGLYDNVHGRYLDNVLVLALAV